MTSDEELAYAGTIYEIYRDELTVEYNLFHQRWLQFILLQAVLFASTALFVFGNIPQLGVYVALGSFCVIGTLSALYTCLVLASSLGNIATTSELWDRVVMPKLNPVLVGTFRNRTISKVAGYLVMAIPAVVAGLWMVVLASVVFEKLRLVWF